MLSPRFDGFAGYRVDERDKRVCVETGGKFRPAGRFSYTHIFFPVKFDVFFPDSCPVLADKVRHFCVYHGDIFTHGGNDNLKRFHFILCSFNDRLILPKNLLILTDLFHAV